MREKKGHHGVHVHYPNLHHSDGPADTPSVCAAGELGLGQFRSASVSHESPLHRSSHTVFAQHWSVLEACVVGLGLGLDLGLGLGLGLLKDNDENITIVQGNRYPQLRSAKG